MCKEKKENIIDGYVIPENAKVREIDVKMWSNGISAFAYQDKRSAVYACAIGVVCPACGNSFEGKHYTVCQECRDKKDNEKYNALELIEWDGETPLCIFGGDEYFYDEDGVESYIDCQEIEGELQLVICHKVSPPDFDIDEFLIDHTPEDFSADDLETKEQVNTGKQIEKMVNDYLNTLSPVWYPSNKRVNLCLKK